YEGITFNHWEIPSNLEDGDYDLCILAQDFSGAVITDTPFAFSKVSAPEFRITGPVGELKDGENHIAPFTSLAITWEPIQLPGIWQYEVSISMKSGCEQPDFPMSVIDPQGRTAIDESSIVPAITFPSGKYYVCVTAIRDGERY